MDCPQAFYLVFPLRINCTTVLYVLDFKYWFVGYSISYSCVVVLCVHMRALTHIVYIGNWIQMQASVCVQYFALARTPDRNLEG